jgi:hypothetical protein
MTAYLLPLLDMMGNWPDWLLNNMPEILMMVMKMKCIQALKDSWGSGSIVSIVLLLGGNGGEIPAGEAVFVGCLP